MQGKLPVDDCPKCGEAKLKVWRDLTADEKMIVDRLPAARAFTPAERKRHHFCTRCWFEQTEPISTTA
ncbi:MAG TPA: hypothetical protein PLP07_09925 [Pyrinomonadaceae bacterium]|nr:hypothetical protein [Chloracidobacterium sp.]MBP9935685.1 hypothetical protein [Pyrinomonadaceae bacterium]MBK7802661.1 hypothetical protein [Chloracidobacterium sp.]MBK9437512.1 hypothetical protein [Chloracidobacterium sp.]MBL0240182.1 hypothetical protein [Chloracidobacterium sp.]